MLKAFLPQPAAMAGGGELLKGEISQHRYAAEFVGAGARRVLLKLTVGNSCKSGVARHLQRATIVASSGTGEMFDAVSDDGFDLQLRICNFALQFRLGKIGEIRMCHRMAADLKTLHVEIAHLSGIKVTGRAQESSGEVEGCVEAELAEHGRGGDKIGLAAIVEGDTNARLGRIANSLANVQAARAGLFDPRHLAAESFEWHDVAYVAGLGLAELTASDLQFVVHQEHNVR